MHVGLGGCSARLYTSSSDRSVRVWDLASKRLVASLVFPAALNGVTVTPNEALVFAAGADGNVYCVDLVRGSSHAEVPLRAGNEAAGAALSAALAPMVMEAHG